MANPEREANKGTAVLLVLLVLLAVPVRGLRLHLNRRYFGLWIPDLKSVM